jgi:hypothetical protein
MHDRALKALEGTGPELRNGAPNHAPMVAEALAALGREEAVPAWLQAYRPRLAEGPRSAFPLDKDWNEALGNFGRLGAWQNLFRRELAEASRREVLDRWLPRLIPGSMASGMHGIIRCAHAARAIENEATAPRLEELANALAYCAARYVTVSGVPLLAGPLDPETAVSQLPLLEREVDRKGPPPRIVKLLNERSDFAAAVQCLAPPAEVSAALSKLAEIGARLYLRDADRHPLVLLHAVTGPAAVQLLLVNASSELADIAFAYTWQAIAAWASAFSSGLSAELPRPVDASWDTIIDLSLQSGDEHAIKFTEACRRQESLRPSAVFRAAAKDWAQRVIESRERTPAELVRAGIRARLSDE